MLIQVLDDRSGFKVRAAALIVRDGRVLLNRLRGGDDWMLPGGTGEFGETTEDTLRRELREELGVDAVIGRRLWIVEHFFDMHGRRWHQLLWIHEATLPDDSGVVRAETWESAGAEGLERFRWTPFSELRALRVLPSFLVDEAADLPSEARHVVCRDFLES